MKKSIMLILTVAGLLVSSRGMLFANSVTEVKAVYPPPQQAAKYNDLVRITAQVEPFAADTVYCDASVFAGAGKTRVLMYDDGQHMDKAVGDGIYGTDTLRVGDDSTNAVYRTVRVYAAWGANKWNCPGLVGIKNRKPFLTPQGTVYPVGQSAAKDSDFVHIKSWVSDVSGKIDLLQVIDVSLSLSVADLESIKVAAKAIVNGLDTTDAAGLMAFSDDLYWKVWRPLTGAAGLQTVKDSIDALERILMTALYDATYMGSDSINRFSKDIPVMVLLSDGDNTTTPYGHTRAQCYFRPIPIFTIAYGSSPDTAFMDSVARTSAGGRYYRAPSGADLDAVVKDINNVLANMNAPNGISEAWADASPIGGPSKVLLYDDGGHSDGAASDTVFGAGPIKVASGAFTGIRDVFVYAADVAYNIRKDTTTTRLDNIIPRVDSLVTTYPVGKNVVSNGEKVFFRVVARDTGSVNGITEVLLDATQIGGPPKLAMYDNGAGNDAVASDGIYASDSITVNTGVYSGTAAIYAKGYDIAANTKVAAGGVVVDNIAPQIANVKVYYPSGQTAAKVGDVLKISALITDDISGVVDTTVILNAANLDSNASRRLYDNGTNGDAVANDHVYTRDITITNAATGTVSFTIAAADSQGNTAAAVTGSVILDNTAPGALTVTVLDPDNIYHNGETVKLRAVTDAAGYRVTANFSPIDNYYLSGAEVVQDSGAGVYFIAYAISQNNVRVNGAYTITATAADGVGLQNTGTVGLALDNSGPKTSGVDFALDPLNDNILNANDTLAAVVKDTNGVTAAEYFIDNTGYDGAGAAMNGTFGPDSALVKGFLDISGLSQGRHTAYIHGQDSTGVWGGYASLNFTVDTQGPSIENLAVVYPQGQTAAAVNDTVIVTALIRDVTTQVDAPTVYLDGANLNGNPNIQMYDDGANGDYAAGDKVYTARVAVTNATSGPVTITVWASDIVPNASSVSGAVRLDNTPPVVSIELMPLPNPGPKNGEVYVSEVILKGSYYDRPDSANIKAVKSVTVTVRNQNGDHVNNSPIVIPVEDGRFSQVIKLVEGFNKIKATVYDYAGLTASDSARLNFIVPEIAQNIGPDGGTVNLADGAKLVVPPGALSSTVRISIKRISPLPAAETGKTLVRYGYELLPADLVFNKDAELTLPYTHLDLDTDQDDTLEIEEQKMDMFYWTHDQWLTQTAKSRLADSNYVKADLNHLGLFALGQKNGSAFTAVKAYWTKNPMVYGQGTDLVYQLNKPGKVSLNIYDMSGDLVYSFSERPGLAGENNFSWDGRAKTGRFIGSGIYVYIFKFTADAGETTVIKKPFGVIK